MLKKMIFLFLIIIKIFRFFKKTKAKYIITHKKYEKIIKKYCNPIIVDNVLKSVC